MLIKKQVIIDIGKYDVNLEDTDISVGSIESPVEKYYNKNEYNSDISIGSIEAPNELLNKEKIIQKEKISEKDLKLILK